MCRLGHERTRRALQSGQGRAAASGWQAVSKAAQSFSAGFSAFESTLAKQLKATSLDTTLCEGVGASFSAGMLRAALTESTAYQVEGWLGSTSLGSLRLAWRMPRIQLVRDSNELTYLLGKLRQALCMPGGHQHHYRADLAGRGRVNGGACQPPVAARCGAWSGGA